MTPNDVLGGVALAIIIGAFLAGHTPALILGGTLLILAIWNNHRATLRHHARQEDNRP